VAAVDSKGNRGVERERERERVREREGGGREGGGRKKPQLCKCDGRKRRGEARKSKSDED
jgi:hypothetical protein